ncbi:decarboxylating 6-phosphogluconate dehydrogenase [soil metagenome]
MELGMVGLGRMGANMSRRLMKGGHEIAAFDVNAAAVNELAAEGANESSSLEDLAHKLTAPRAVWVMVPAGDITERTIAELGNLLSPGDAIIDGGNSRYTDSVARAAQLQAKGIDFVDAGTSGGVWGLAEGFCLMIGARKEVFARLEPLFATLAPPDGYALVGSPGAGHFVKMVHNGIEYALMQAYGEGFEILESSDFDLDLSSVAEVWRHGSVIRSWLLDLAAAALAKDPHLEGIEGYVEDSGEGRWTVQTALDNAVAAPTIALSLFTRFSSRQDDAFSNRLLAALRNEFGGHEVKRR